MATKYDPTKPLTAKDVRECWDKGAKSINEERNQAAINHQFIGNKHWLYWNPGSNRVEEIPRSPTRVRATVPRVGPDSRRILSKLLRRGLVFDVPPDSADDGAMQGARVAESALAQVARDQDWEGIRTDHAYCAWEAGVAAISVEWDWQAGTIIGEDENGRQVGTGDVKLTALSIHEIATEPGARDIERARYWVRGQALPPAEVQAMYGLEDEPKPDAKSADVVWKLGDRDTVNTPLVMVYTYYERPFYGSPGRVVTCVGETIVDEGPWPFPFTDRLNVGTAVVEPIHGKWVGRTPVSDAVGVQTLYNASWSSIIEHMKQAGNARLMSPMGAIDDIELLSDNSGEIVEYNPINGTRPDYMSPPTMPDWWIRQPGMLEDVMDNILGQHDVSRGEAPTGVESGVALSILSENDDTPIGALAKSIAEMWGRVATMVLKLYAANVEESRQATIHDDDGVPTGIKWSGETLAGQTTAVVPLDAVIPRSRAAQAAFALQLYDREIITNPTSLAKVADLPDQASMLEGIDPDSARARRENSWLANGKPRTVDTIDDHSNHINVHRDFQRSERFENLPIEVQQLVRDHVTAHELYAAEQAAAQAQAAGISPIAAALPTEATKVLPAADLAEAGALSMMTPAAQTAMPIESTEPSEETTDE
jgi:hypothetical protein